MRNMVVVRCPRNSDSEFIFVRPSVSVEVHVGVGIGNALFKDGGRKGGNVDISSTFDVS